MTTPPTFETKSRRKNGCELSETMRESMGKGVLQARARVTVTRMRPSQDV